MRSYPFILLFYVAGPLYVAFQAVLVSSSLVSILRGHDRGWVVTQRATMPHGPSTPGATSTVVSPPKPGPLSPFIKPAPGGSGEATEPVLGFALTRFYTPDEPDPYRRTDSIGGGLDTLAGIPETARAPSLSRNGASSRVLNGDNGYQQML